MTQEEEPVPENPAAPALDPIVVTRVRLFVDAAGEWRWAGDAGNYRSVAVSGEGYKNRTDALRPAASFFPDALLDSPDVERGVTVLAAYHRIAAGLEA